MKKLILAFATVAALPALAQDHYIKGYIKKDGTYVAPSYATNPNSTKLDNYSTLGNVNPYTGIAGTRSPYPAYTPAYTSPATVYTPSAPMYTSPSYVYTPLKKY